MSLKGFHIVFIALAAFCSLGFAVWTFLAPPYVVTESLRISGWISAVAGLSLMVYGVWFVFKKSRRIIL